MKILTEPTYWVKLYLSGPIDHAKHIIRRYALKGLCVTIEPTTFMYTMGEESGYVVGFINYPRFPKSSEEILNTANDLAQLLLNETYQGSALIMDPVKTTWITKRED